VSNQVDTASSLILDGRRLTGSDPPLPSTSLINYIGNYLILIYMKAHRYLLGGVLSIAVDDRVGESL